MKMVFKLIAMLSLFVLALSCNKDHFPNTAPTEFSEMRKNATPEFRQGWEAGCETGSASTSNHFHRMVLYDSTNVDGYKITQSNDYRTAWNFAWWYCYRYMFIKHKSSIWGPVFGGYK